MDLRPSSTMISVRSNWPMFSALIRKYAWSGTSTLTPAGMYTNEPPLHTAELSAANLLSWIGMILPKYSFTRSGCSRTAVSVSAKMTPFFWRSSRRLW